MKLKLYCVGVDASLKGSLYRSWLDVLGSIGMKLTSGIILIVKTTMFERTFVISDPMAINRKETGFRNGNLKLTPCDNSILTPEVKFISTLFL